MKASSRAKIKSKNFALPEKAKTAGAKKQSGNYPIHDAKHARLALSMVAAHGSAAEQRRVKNAVRKKYPNIGVQ
jgi:hypothetical protein